MKRISNWG